MKVYFYILYMLYMKCLYHVSCKVNYYIVTEYHFNFSVMLHDAYIVHSYPPLTITRYIFIQ